MKCPEGSRGGAVSQQKRTYVIKLRIDCGAEPHPAECTERSVSVGNFLPDFTDNGWPG